VVIVSQLAGTVSWMDEWHALLPALPLALTMVTGNVVFFCFAVADPKNFSIPASLGRTAGT